MQTFNLEFLLERENICHLLIRVTIQSQPFLHGKGRSNEEDQIVWIQNWRRLLKTSSKENSHPGKPGREKC